MKNLILTIAMNTAITIPLLAQQTSNWMGATKQTLGPQASASWMFDLETDGLEVHVSPEKALVLVDHSPIITTATGEAYFKAGILGLAGTRLTIQGEVESIDDSFLHGRYAGTLDGQPVVMDQYMLMRNGAPTRLVRVIRSVQGSAHVPNYGNVAYVRSLLSEELTANGPVLVKD
jgi:hypothetical protein